MGFLLVASSPALLLLLGLLLLSLPENTKTQSVPFFPSPSLPVSLSTSITLASSSGPSSSSSSSSTTVFSIRYGENPDVVLSSFFSSLPPSSYTSSHVFELSDHVRKQSLLFGHDSSLRTIVITFHPVSSSSFLSFSASSDAIVSDVTRILSCLLPTLSHAERDERPYAVPYDVVLAVPAGVVRAAADSSSSSSSAPAAAAAADAGKDGGGDDVSSEQLLLALQREYANSSGSPNVRFRLVPSRLLADDVYGLVRAVPPSSSSLHHVFAVVRSTLASCPVPVTVDRGVVIDMFMHYSRSRYSRYGNFSSPLVMSSDDGSVMLFDEATYRLDPTLERGHVMRIVKAPDYGHDGDYDDDDNDKNLLPRLSRVADDVDDDSPPLSSSSSSSSALPPITLLLPEHDLGQNLTYSVFSDVLSVLLHGFLTLGYPCTILRCPIVSLGNCTPSDLHAKAENGGVLIVLAPHLLESVQGNDGKAVILERPEYYFPKGTVLYNFEYVPPTTSTTTSSISVSASASMSASAPASASSSPSPPSATDHPSFASEATTIKLYRNTHFDVWDYCHANARHLQQWGVRDVRLVPFGYGPSLLFAGKVVEAAAANAAAEDSSSESSSSSSTSSSSPRAVVAPLLLRQDIDVLFYGTMTPHRRSVVNSLRAVGVHVFVPNVSNWGSYGLDLDLLVLRSKIVLSLKSFGQDDEWKITRLGRLLANEVFVVSERGEDYEEQRYYTGGVMFVDVEDMKQTIEYYLLREDERRDVAKEGKRKFMAMEQTEILRKVGL